MTLKGSALVQHLQSILRLLKNLFMVEEIRFVGFEVSISHLITSSLSSQDSVLGSITQRVEDFFILDNRS